MFPGGSDGKASAYSAGNLGSISGLGRYPGEGNGNPLQYSCLENPMDGGAWEAACHFKEAMCSVVTMVELVGVHRPNSGARRRVGGPKRVLNFYYTCSKKQRVMLSVRA